MGMGLQSPSKIESMDEAVRMLKGPPGTTVRLTIVSAGKNESEAHIVSLIRQTFNELWGDGRLLETGLEAPEIPLKRLPEEQPARLSDYRGKIVILMFWASWCGPCQAEMAESQTLLEKHPAWQGKVIVLTVSVDEHKENIVKRLSERHWDKTVNVWTGFEALRAYHVDEIPTTYVIAADGRIVAAAPRDVADVVEKLAK